MLSLASASVQPASVFLLLFCPFDRRIGFGERRFNRWVFGSVLLPLWTTAPAFKLEFCRIIRCVTSVEPTQFKPLRRINRCLLSRAAGSVHRLNRRGAPVHVGLTGVYTVCVPQLLLLAVCFRVTFRLFLGLFCASVASP